MSDSSFAGNGRKAVTSTCPADLPVPSSTSARRRRGRPRELVEPSQMTISLEAAIHDQLIQEAARRGVTPGRLARLLLHGAVKQLCRRGAESRRVD